VLEVVEAMMFAVTSTFGGTDDPGNKLIRNKMHLTVRLFNPRRFFSNVPNSSSSRRSAADAGRATTTGRRNDRRSTDEKHRYVFYYYVNY